MTTEAAGDFRSTFSVSDGAKPRASPKCKASARAARWSPRIRLKTSLKREAEPMSPRRTQRSERMSKIGCMLSIAIGAPPRNRLASRLRKSALEPAMVASMNDVCDFDRIWPCLIASSGSPVVVSMITCSPVRTSFTSASTSSTIVLFGKLSMTVVQCSQTAFALSQRIALVLLDVAGSKPCIS